MRARREYDRQLERFRGALSELELTDETAPSSVSLLQSLSVVKPLNLRAEVLEVVTDLLQEVIKKVDAILDEDPERDQASWDEERRDDRGQKK